MSDIKNGFGTRLKNVERKHARMANGYDCKVGQDGLIVFKPVRRKARFPWRGMLLLLVGFLCFKGIVMAHMGSDAYEEQITSMRHGQVYDQIGAFVMQVDPVTQAVATKVSPLL